MIIPTRIDYSTRLEHHSAYVIAVRVSHMDLPANDMVAGVSSKYRCPT